MKTLLALVMLALSVRGGSTLNIRTAQEFINFADAVNSGSAYSDATVYLQDDIDFTGVSSNFSSIGRVVASQTSFSGVFDGQGHTISYLNLKNTNYWHYGLFGISYGATVRNLIMDKTCTVVGVSVTNSSGVDPDTLNVGGIFGFCEAYNSPCLLENNIFMGEVTFVGSTPKITNVHVAGIIGNSYAYEYTATVKNCVNYGSISFSGRADTLTMGGVVGSIAARNDGIKSYLYNCLNYGYIYNIGTLSTYITIGGVVGANSYGREEINSIVNLGYISSINTGKTSNDVLKRIGSLTGILYQIELSNSYWVSFSNYDFAGQNNGGSTLECSNFSSTTFTLVSPVSVGSYSGNSLISALNAGSELYASRGYSKWLLNKNINAVSFLVNGNPLIKVNSQVILIPSLADGVSKKFSGWYTDSSCTSLLTNYEISTSTTLYGKLA